MLSLGTLLAAIEVGQQMLMRFYLRGIAAVLWQSLPKLCWVTAWPYGFGARALALPVVVLASRLVVIAHPLESGSRCWSGTPAKSG